MKAVVMAGGEGSRLRPLTVARPKPMVPIVNKPVIQHIFDLLKRHHITDVVVTVQYLASSIQDAFGDGSDLGLKITYSVEDTPLGTAGSVKNAQKELDDTFIVISGDALTDFDLTAIIDFHKQRRAMATLTLYHVPNPLDYGVIVTDEDGCIRRFLEKPGWGEVFSDTVNTGIYVLEPGIFDYIESGRSVDFSQDVFPQLLRQGEALYGYIASGYWCDVGNIAEYMQANADLLMGKVNLEPLGKHLGGDVWCESDDVEIAPDAQLYGHVWLGNSSKVKGGVIIHGPSVVHSYSIIDSRAHIDRCIIWRNSYIGEHSEVQGAIIGQQCSLKSKVMIFEGVVIGDLTTVGQGAIIQPNIKIWPNKEIEAGTRVSSSIVWGAQGRRVLFGRWGVAGLVNIDLTPEFVAKLGAAYGATLPRGATVAMNRDPHRSSRMLKRAMISGLPSAGVHVLDIKSMPIPVARYVTRVSDTIGGVHVRISPFDNRAIDIKFFDQHGFDVDRNAQRKIENIFFREDFRRVYMDEIGRITEAPQLVDLYVKHLVKSIDSSILHPGHPCLLVIDYANSTASSILQQILNQFGCNVVPINAAVEEDKLSRSAEEFQEDMRKLGLITKSLQAKFGARLDAGGEIVSVVDDQGELLPGWTLLAAVALLMLKENPGGNIAVPVTAPNVFEALAAMYGGNVIRTKASTHSLTTAASHERCILAGDENGGLVFPHFQPAMDGLHAIAKIHELLLKQNTELAEVVRSLPPYYITRTKVPCPWEDKGRVMRLLSEQYKDQRVRQIDGIKIELGEEWVLVLPDTDRPLFHIIVEATSSEGAKVLSEKYAALVSSLQH
ncbi:MAG: mannose-1-phosphate guanyltransferase [Chloroflexi bacterium]|nr:mannose-1-phosphate guanyltransferase [Chloroflexota bacterium]